jgi:hypothetical protein
MISGEKLGTKGEETLDLLADLERSTPDAVKRARAHTRLDIRCKVIAQHADSSRRLDLKLQGVTGDVSRGGCQILFPVPLGVGDIYLITFDRGALDVNPVIARCMRCRMIREDAYETGLSFFNQIDLPEEAADPDEPLA